MPINAKTLRFLLRLSPVLLVVCLTSASYCAQSQSSSEQSVAQAARRAREREKKEGKPIKVITNDDLERMRKAEIVPEISTATASPIGEQPGAAPAAGAAQTSSRAKASASGQSANKTESEKRAKELADSKKKLADAQSDLDLLQRQLALQRDTYYSNPDYIHDTAGRAQLDQLNQQINDKKQAVEELKARVSELEKLVGAASPSKKSSAPPQS